MIKNFYFSVILILILGACVNGEQTISADYTHLLSGGNSKVWMVSGFSQDLKNSFTQEPWGEYIFVFDINGAVMFGSFYDLHNHSFTSGHFQYGITSQKLSMHLNNIHWIFELESVEQDQLILKKIKGQDLSTYLRLIPLPIPN